MYIIRDFIYASRPKHIVHVGYYKSTINVCEGLQR